MHNNNSFECNKIYQEGYEDGFKDGLEYSKGQLKTLREEVSKLKTEIMSKPSNEYVTCLEEEIKFLNEMLSKFEYKKEK